MRSGFRIGLGALAAFAGGVAATAQAPGLAPGEGLQTVQTLCSSCHTLGVVTAHAHTAQEWDEIIGKMLDKGMLASDQQLDEIAANLAKNYAPQAAAPAPATAGDAPKAAGPTP